MSTFGIILLVLAGILALLFIGGLVATARRRKENEGQLHRRIEEANEKLAEAHAADNGWDPVALEAAALEAFVAAGGDRTKVNGVHLVHIVDRPGIEGDEAHFKVDVAMARDKTVTLVRDAAGVWVPVA